MNLAKNLFASLATAHAIVIKFSVLFLKCLSLAQRYLEISPGQHIAIRAFKTDK